MMSTGNVKKIPNLSIPLNGLDNDQNKQTLYNLLFINQSRMHVDSVLS